MFGVLVGLAPLAVEAREKKLVSPGRVVPAALREKGTVASREHERLEEPILPGPK